MAIICNASWRVKIAAEGYMCCRTSARKMEMQFRAIPTRRNTMSHRGLATFTAQFAQRTHIVVGELHSTQPV